MTALRVWLSVVFTPYEVKPVDDISPALYRLHLCRVHLSASFALVRATTRLLLPWNSSEGKLSILLWITQQRQSESGEPILSSYWLVLWGANLTNCVTYWRTAINGTERINLFYSYHCCIQTIALVAALFGVAVSSNLGEESIDFSGWMF